MSSGFPIEKGMKQGDALSTLLFNVALEYAIRKVQENNLALDMKGTHQVLAYADDVNLIGDYIITRKRNADVLLNACKDIFLTVNTRKIKCMEIGRHRGMIPNVHIKIVIRNVLKRRRECGTYLATARRHRRRLKMQKRDE